MLTATAKPLWSVCMQWEKQPATVFTGETVLQATLYWRALCLPKEPIPVVPSQQYFMGGIAVDRYSKTSMDHLYAAGETACNGVHGKNRLASNSLLESLVFAKRAARHIMDGYTALEPKEEITIDKTQYQNYKQAYKKAVLAAIEKERLSHE